MKVSRKKARHLMSNGKDVMEMQGLRLNNVDDVRG